MDGAVHVRTIQGSVTHAVHWLRSIPTTQYGRRLVDDGQYVDRRNLLCSIRRSFNHSDSVVRHIKTTLSRKGWSFPGPCVLPRNTRNCEGSQVLKGPQAIAFTSHSWADVMPNCLLFVKYYLHK